MSTILIAKRQTLGLLTYAFILLFSIVGAGSYGSMLAPQEEAQNKQDKKEKDKQAAKLSPNAPAKTGTPVLWAERGDLSTLDLYWGIGGPDKAPQPPFTFEKEDTGGAQPKIEVTDGKGIKWNIKLDRKEAHAEVAASRVVWAAGYLVEESYFIPTGNIEGAKNLRRAKKYIGMDGTFNEARFEKRPDNIARHQIRWSWDANPFVGTKELSGLAILNTLLNNWDARASNNNVLGMFDAEPSARWAASSHARSGTSMTFANRLSLMRFRAARSGSNIAAV
jgi:hypothetical protein